MNSPVKHNDWLQRIKFLETFSIGVQLLTKLLQKLNDILNFISTINFRSYTTGLRIPMFHISLISYRNIELLLVNARRLTRAV